MQRRETDDREAVAGRGARNGPVLKHGPRSRRRRRVRRREAGSGSRGRRTRDAVSYAWAGRSRGKPRSRPGAVLTCKSIVGTGHRGERPIEPRWLVLSEMSRRTAGRDELRRVEQWQRPGRARRHAHCEAAGRAADGRAGIRRPSGPVLVSRTGDAGRTERGDKVPKCAQG